MHAHIRTNACSQHDTCLIHERTNTAQCTTNLCPDDTSYLVGGFEGFAGVGQGSYQYFNGQTTGGWTFGNSAGVAYQASDWSLVAGSQQRVSFIQSCSASLCENMISTNMTNLVSGSAVCKSAMHSRHANKHLSVCPLDEEIFLYWKSTW
jgi:hypothetical protein